MSESIREWGDHDTYYLNIADAVSGRSKCLKRRIGSVLVRDDVQVSQGFNGPPRGAEHCKECKRVDAKRGGDYGECPAVHAEVNSLVFAKYPETVGSTLYIVGREMDGRSMKDFHPCWDCLKVLVNAGVKEFVTDSSDGLYVGSMWDCFVGYDPIDGYFRRK